MVDTRSRKYEKLPQYYASHKQVESESEGENRQKGSQEDEKPEKSMEINLIPESDLAFNEKNQLQEISAEDLTDEEMLKIHEAIHDKDRRYVDIRNKQYPIKVASNNCRHIRLRGTNIMQQNVNKDSRYAEMARKGKKITWIMKSGSWGLIIDGKIARR